MNGNKLLIPLAIVVVGLLIGGSVMFSNKGNVNNNQNEPVVIEFDSITAEDHILGSPEAEVFVIEYSDYECPFCGQFHPTMDQIISEYGESKKVAWVFRHFPIDRAHPKARLASEASECVAEIGGNNAFWEYSSKLFAGSPESLSKENLIKNAVEIKVDENSFKACLDSGKYSQKVEKNYQDGLKAAMADPQFGTPYSIVFNKKTGKQLTVAGAQPYSVVKQVIESLLE